ncbi:MAG: response regulator [Chloroflexi bacterium]|nr:MAG: response regulator [Phototrophicales bacterium]RMF77148.1 MAG: response regulator [Chloroflexota bacterium]
MALEALLIEDSPTQATQIKLTLESVGLSVRVASDGPEGIREATENPPALIVLDVNLPSMDGFQVCRRLKRNAATAAIPVIMLTDQADPKATMSGIEAGADDYIPKDIFASEHLVATLQDLGILSE